MSLPTTTQSATSMNFIGFDEMKGNGTAPILFNRVKLPADTFTRLLGLYPGSNPT